MNKRAPILLIAASALFAAIWGGLVRLGWSDGASGGARLAAAHGPLMVVAFLGTVITLERAVAAKVGWTYAAPVLSVASGGLTLLIPSSVIGPALGAGAACVLIVIVARAIRRTLAVNLFIEGLGAVAWLVGQCLLVASATLYSRAVPWWSAFLLLTILGERVELGRVLAPSRVGTVVLWSGLVAFLLGIGLTLFDDDLGARTRALGMIALAVWIARFNVPRHALHGSGLPLFLATSLTIASAWLAIAGALWMKSGWVAVGPSYDASLHAFFLGVIVTMIFAHAPIVFPAVTGVRIPMHRSFYAHLIVLQVGLVMRVIGDVWGAPDVRAWGGMLNAIAIVLFFASTAVQAANSTRATISMTK